MRNIVRSRIMNICIRRELLKHTVSSSILPILKYSTDEDRQIYLDIYFKLLGKCVYMRSNIEADEEKLKIKPRKTGRIRGWELALLKKENSYFKSQIISKNFDTKDFIDSTALIYRELSEQIHYPEPVILTEKEKQELLDDLAILHEELQKNADTLRFFLERENLLAAKEKPVSDEEK